MFLSSDNHLFSLTVSKALGCILFNFIRLHVIFAPQHPTIKRTHGDISFYVVLLSMDGLRKEFNTGMMNLKLKLFLFTTSGEIYLLIKEHLHTCKVKTDNQKKADP